MTEPHKFVLNLTQRLNWRSYIKHVALQNLSIIAWGNIWENSIKTN